MMTLRIKHEPIRSNTFADLPNVAKSVDRRKRDFLKAMGIEGENALKAEADRISTFGTLSRSIYHEITGIDQGVVIGSNLEYSTAALETGRKPGKTPPSKALELWARKRGLPRGTGYIIARSIAKKGTYLYRSKAPKRVTRTRKLLFEYKLPRLINQYLLT